MKLYYFLSYLIYIFMNEPIFSEKIYASANMKTIVNDLRAYMLRQYLTTKRQTLCFSEIGERRYYDTGEVEEVPLDLGKKHSVQRNDFAFLVDRKLLSYEEVDELPADKQELFCSPIMYLHRLIMPTNPTILANAAKLQIKGISQHGGIEINRQHFCVGGSFVCRKERLSLYIRDGLSVYSAEEALGHSLPHYRKAVKKAAEQGQESFLVDKQGDVIIPDGRFCLVPRSTYKAWAKHAVRQRSWWSRNWRYLVVGDISW